MKKDQYNKIIKEEIRFDINYSSIKNFIKKYQDSFFDFNPEKHNPDKGKKKNYDGFDSLNIPRLKNCLLDESKPAYKYNQRIVKSCIGKRKNNEIIKHDSYHTKKKEELKKEAQILESVKEENNKLRNILSRQMKKDILNKRMPKISYIPLKPVLEVKIKTDIKKMSKMK